MSESKRSSSGKIARAIGPRSPNTSSEVRREKDLLLLNATATPLLCRCTKRRRSRSSSHPSPIDTALISFLEEKLSCKFQRIEGLSTPSLLDASREKTLLDADGKTEAARIADFIRTALDKQEMEVEAKSLSSDRLPALFSLRREPKTATRLHGAHAREIGAPMPSEKNLHHQHEQQADPDDRKAQEKQPDVAKEMAKGIYDLSLLSQREVEPGDIDRVVFQQTEILEKLSALLVHS